MIFGDKMYYHVRITQKSNKIIDELKLDLSEEKLRSQFITPYENGENHYSLMEKQFVLRILKG